MRKLAYVIVILLFSATGFSNTYFVSASGNDSNSGLSIAEAWRTIDKVNTFSFAAGDIISFEGGATFTGGIDNPALGNGIPGNSITITSYGTGKAHISSGLLEGIFIQDAGNLTITNLKISGSGYKISGMYTCGIDFYLDSLTSTRNIDNVVVDNVEIFGFGGFGIQFMNVSASYSFNHLRITNCLLHDNGVGGLIVGSSVNSTTNVVNIINDDVYVGYTKAYNNYGRLDKLYNWSGIGILLDGATNSMIEYCESYNNGKENGCAFAGPVGIFLGDSRNVVIQHCSSHNNFGGPGKRDGGGFDLDQGSYGCVIQYCESYENEGAGYGIYQASSGNPFSNDTIRYNTSVNDGRYHSVYGAFTFWGATSTYPVTNTEIYGNQVTMNKTGYGLVFINNNLDKVNFYNNSFCLEAPALFLNYKNPVPLSENAQLWGNSFPCSGQPFPILAVPYRGAFAAAPSPMWTNGWTNYDPQNAVYAGPDSIIQSPITSNLTLSGTKSYLLKGTIYVTNNAVLQIEPGCVIKGDKSSSHSSLIITRGAKINGNGTPFNPIVFTSGEPAGARAPGDWGGIYILGNGHYNGPGGSSHIPGLPTVPENAFGGGVSPNDTSYSGMLEYIRIEYGGGQIAPGLAMAGLNLMAAGNKTILNHLQVSYSAGDGFKWVGGAVNASHLVSYRNTDDNWDTDNGYNGAVQFALGISDPLVANATSAGSNSFSTQNDEAGSDNKHYTSGLFTNITDIGPLRGNATATISNGYGSHVRFSNRSHLRILNSLLLDYPAGLFVDGEQTAVLARAPYLSPVPNSSPGNLVFRNNLLAGNPAGQVLQQNSPWDMTKWFGDHRNDSLASTSTLLVDPYLVSGYAYTGDYRPKPGSPALKNYNWNDSAFYKIEPNGARTNLIGCPVGTPAPAAIAGPIDKCSSLKAGRTARYYLTDKSITGILGYTWSAPAGATVIAGQGTDTVTVQFNPTFTSGTLQVRNLSYCGATSSAKSFTISYTAGLAADTVVNIICAEETINLIPLYSISGFTNTSWSTSTPQSASAGTYFFMATAANGCKDTAFAVVKQDIAVWTGSASTNWHHGANWSTGVVPTAKTHVIIQGNTGNACEISDDDGLAASVQVKSSGGLSLLNNKQLILAGKCDPLPTGL